MIGHSSVLLQESRSSSVTWTSMYQQYIVASASSDCYFLMGLDPGAERSLRELSILFADVAKFY